MSDEDIEEELGYISPLDSVDPYLAFKRSLSSEYSVTELLAVWRMLMILQFSR